MTVDKQQRGDKETAAEVRDLAVDAAVVSALQVGKDVASLVKPALNSKEEDLFGGFMLCGADGVEVAGDKKATAAEKENKRAADYLKEVTSGTNAIDVSNSIYSRLPDKMAVRADKQTVSVSTDSMEKVLKAIPGFKIPDNCKLDGLKSVTLDGNTLRLAGKGTLELPDGKGGTVSLTMDNMRGEIKVDPADPTRVSLTNISGFSANKMMADVAIKEVRLKLNEDKDGNLSLTVEPTKLEGAKSESKSDLLAGLKGTYNKIGAAVGGTKIEPFELPLCNKKDAPIQQVVGELDKWVNQPDKRDAGKVAESISGLYIDKQFSSLFSGVKSVEKNGNNFKLTSDGGSLHHMGGLPLAWDKEVNIKVEPGAAPKATFESGLKVQLPIPDEVAAACGLKNPQEYPIKEISLGEPDKDGNRVATMKMDGPVESLSIKVTPRMEPVPVDKENNVRLTAKLKDTNVGLDLTFNPQQVASGKTDQIDFKLSVTENHGQLPASIEKFLGQELDGTVRDLVSGMRSFERKGDKVTITREKATNHELAGLKVVGSDKISFKLSSDKEGIRIRNMEGISIASLPGFANTIYKTRLPIVLDSLDLSTANKDGSRTISMKSSGAVRAAVVDVDATMKPKDIWVTVENPVDAFRDQIPLGLNPRALSGLSTRIKDDTKYTIRIKANGDVDFGGLTGAADMFSKAGDLHSIDGAAATVIGAGGKALNGKAPEAARDVYETAKKSWGQYFK